MNPSLSLPSPKNSTTVRDNTLTLRLLGLASRLARPSPALSLALARYAFLTPPRFDFPESERPWLASAERSTIRTHGLPIPAMDHKRVQIYRWGEAKEGRVLLLHGWGGRGTQMGAFIEPLQQRGFEIIALDAPGHGLSEGKQSSLPQFANALQRTIAQVGSVEAVITHSFGGAALAYAGHQGLRFGKAVLVAPPSDPSDFVQEILKALQLPAAIGEALIADIARRFSLNWDDIAVSKLTEKLSQPALIIHDHNDREVPFRAGEKVAAHWPGARLLATEGLGHKRILKSPLVIEAALDFIQGKKPPGTA